MGCNNKEMAVIIDEGQNPLVKYIPRPCSGLPEFQIGGGGDYADWWTTPFVSKDEEYIQEGERWIIKETWTLTGQILGCKGYAQLLKRQQLIRELFASDYGNLTVGNTNALKTLYYATLSNITFGAGDFLSSVDYTITFEGYRNAESLEDDKAVVDPTSNYTWAEEEDGTMRLTHEVSAKGLQTDKDPLTNAQAFVNARLASNLCQGVDEEGNQSELPFIIDMSVNPTFKRYLVSEEATVNRLGGTYAVVRTYKTTQTEDTYEILRYTVESRVAIEEDKTVTFSGEIELGYKNNTCAGAPEDDPSLSLGGNMSLLRARYKKFKSSKLIDPETSEALTTILSEDVSEDQLGGKLTFTLVCGPRDEECIKDYDVRVSESHDGSLITVAVNGTVKAPGPCSWEFVSGCFYGEDYKSMIWPSTDPVAPTPNRTYLKLGAVNPSIFLVAVSGYNEFKADHAEIGGHAPYPLNFHPVTYDITEDPINKTISFNIEYNDRISWGAHRLDYDMNFTLPVKSVAVNAYADATQRDGDDSYHKLDLGFAKAGNFSIKLQVDGTAGDIGNTADDFYGFAVDKFARNVDYTIEEDEGMYVIVENYGTTDSESKLKDYNFQWIWQKGGNQGYVNTKCKNGGVCTEVDNLYFGNE